MEGPGTARVRRLVLPPSQASTTASKSIEAVTGLTRKLPSAPSSVRPRCESASRPVVVTMVTTTGFRTPLSRRCRCSERHSSMPGNCPSMNTTSYTSPAASRWPVIAMACATSHATSTCQPSALTIFDSTARAVALSSTTSVRSPVIPAASAADSSSGSPGASANFTPNRKLLPRPTSLSTSMLPPINPTNL